MSENESLLDAAPIAAPETTPVENSEPTVSAQSEVVAEQPKEQSFFDSLPDDLKRFEPTLGKFNNKDDLAKSYVELSNKLGKRFEDMSEDEIISLNSKFGVPKEASEYGLEDPEKIIDASGLAETLKELGVPKHLGPKILDHLKNEQKEIQKNNSELSDTEFLRKQEETKTALKREYGLDYVEKLGLAKNAILHEENGQQILDKLNKAGLGSDIDIIKMFVNRGQALSEDKLLGNNVGSFGMSPAEAESEIARLRSNPDFLASYSNIGHPDHAANLKKLEELSRIRAAGK